MFNKCSNEDTVFGSKAKITKPLQSAVPGWIGKLPSNGKSIHIHKIEREQPFWLSCLFFHCSAAWQQNGDCWDPFFVQQQGKNMPFPSSLLLDPSSLLSTRLFRLTCPVVNFPLQPEWAYLLQFSQCLPRDCWPGCGKQASRPIVREHCFPTFSPITTFVLRTTSLTDDKPRAWPKSEAASRHRCGRALAACPGVVIDRGLAPMAARGLSNSPTSSKLLVCRQLRTTRAQWGRAYRNDFMLVLCGIDMGWLIGVLQPKYPFRYMDFSRASKSNYNRWRF